MRKEGPQQQGLPLRSSKRAAGLVRAGKKPVAPLRALLLLAPLLPTPIYPSLSTQSKSARRHPVRRRSPPCCLLLPLNDLLRVREGRGRCWFRWVANHSSWGRAGEHLSPPLGGYKAGAPQGRRTSGGVPSSLLRGIRPMGNCFATRVKAESPPHGSPASGVNSNCSSRDANDLNGSSRRVSVFSVPATPRSEGEILQSTNLRSFTFNDLKNATRNFRPDSVLGEGGFGSVFKGWIDEHSFTAAKPGTGMVIAVKRLNQEGFQGHKEWLAEVNYLGQFHHLNLVKLIGYCIEDEQRLLVYEFMPRGSLENHLFRRASYFQPLSWNLRMKVALGAAEGLAFLHSAKVIYRDFKTSNVLLDSNYNAKLSDFGLAKDGPIGDKSHVSTRVMGTYGYAAPEYLATGHLTARSDVYGFGVVLLELLSGRRAVDKSRPSGEHSLVDWARPYLNSKRRIFRLLDTRLEGQYSMVGAQKVAALALRCLSTEAKFRPRMEEIVAVLADLQDAKDAVRNSCAAEQTRSRRRSLREFGNRKVPHPRPSASPHHS